MNININIAPNADELGARAAQAIAQLINEAIEDHNSCRIVLSTGASQFSTLSHLINIKGIPWERVEMFHLDEYVGLPETHKASFRKYLKERFVSKVPLKAAHFVNGEGDVKKNISDLTKQLRSAPIDIGVIGIGENGHIAFNDPPADFDTEDAYLIVNLDNKCKLQQVHEGWFSKTEDVPNQAISMAPKQIMACKHIITAAPFVVKQDAIYKTLTSPVSNMIPATILKTHPDWQLFIEDASAEKLFPVH